MAISNLTLKLPFLRLNQAKQNEFEYYQSLNTSIANQILALPKKERKKLSSADFAHIDFASMWVNQTIRNAKARTKVKQFKSLPLETNNQAWKLHKVGDTYSISFNLHRGRGKRIPLEIHQAEYRQLLDGLLEDRIAKGTLKLWWSKKGIWYALISLSMEVPDSTEPQGWIGVDRIGGRIILLQLPCPMGWLNSGAVRESNTYAAPQLDCENLCSKPRNSRL